MTQAMLACLLLQSTWVVDDGGGPGVDFTDLPPAIAAAADGDILLVQPGTYSPFALWGKGLRILGSGAGVTWVQGACSGVQAQSSISNVPATSIASLDGVGFLATGSPPSACERLLISGSTTRVILADLTIQGFPSYQGQPALRVSGALVEMTRSNVAGGDGVIGFSVASSGGSALLAEGGARVHVSSSTLAGGTGGGQMFTNMCFGNGGAGGAGVAATTGSQVWIANSTVTGGGGRCCSGAAWCPCGPGGPGIQAEGNAFVRVSGDSTSLVQGGNAIPFGGPCSIPGPGITATSSTVIVHSTPVLGGVCWPFPSCSAPPTSGGTIQLNAAPLPVLDVSGSLNLAGSATISLSSGPPGAPFVLALAGAPAYLSAGSLFLGEILVDPVDWFPLFTGNLSAAGGFLVTIPLAGIAPGFVHTPIHLQGIALDPSGALWRVSNWTVATLRP